MAQRKPFLLRVSPELLAALEAWAGDELRSVNGQIEYLLAEAVKRRRSAGKGSFGDTAKAEPEPENRDGANARRQTRREES